MRIENILLIEDNPQYREAAKNVFGQYGIDVAGEAGTLAESKKALEKDYGFIFLDGFFPIYGEGDKKDSRLEEDLLREIGEVVKRNKNCEGYGSHKEYNRVVNLLRSLEGVPLGETCSSVLVTKCLEEQERDFMIATTGGHGGKEAVLRINAEKQGYAFFIEENKEFPKSETGYWKRAIQVAEMLLDKKENPGKYPWTLYKMDNDLYRQSVEFNKINSLYSVKAVLEHEGTEIGEGLSRPIWEPLVLILERDPNKECEQIVGEIIKDMGEHPDKYCTMEELKDGTPEVVEGDGKRISIYEPCRGMIEKFWVSREEIVDFYKKARKGLEELKKECL